MILLADLLGVIALCNGTGSPSDNCVLKLPVDVQEKVDTFREFVKKHVAEHSMSPEHIINMDEVPLTFGIPMQGPSVAQKSVNIELVMTNYTSQWCWHVVEMDLNCHRWSFSNIKLCRKMNSPPAQLWQ